MCISAGIATVDLTYCIEGYVFVDSIFFFLAFFLIILLCYLACK